MKEKKHVEMTNLELRNELLSFFLKLIFGHSEEIEDPKSFCSLVNTGFQMNTFCVSFTANLQKEDFIKLLNKASVQKNIKFYSIEAVDPNDLSTSYSLSFRPITKPNTIQDLLNCVENTNIEFGLLNAIRNQKPDMALKVLASSLKAGARIKKFSKSRREAFFHLLEKFEVDF